MPRSDAPPMPVTVTDHLWIPMPDGVRLAARLWLPDDTGPVPAILEYIPYRKADMVRARDERNHPFFAANGYACIRVDMRGSGDSEGHMPDMYAQHELDDARHVIAWLAEQLWCNGRVGMFGTSWGGTASLQASVNSPAPLKAVIAVCATHDRYTDDIHHMGGCVLTDSVEWGATLPAILAAPPTGNAGPNWQDLWRDRIAQLTCPLANWLRSDGRGAYWRHGSVIHRASELDVPILAIGGWSDRYSNSVLSLAEARPDLVQGIVGPWGHHYPDHGHPGPAMGFQHIALGWWDRWLKQEQSDPSDSLHLQVWERTFEEPNNAIDTRTGQWVQQSSAAQRPETTLHLSAKGLTSDAGTGLWRIPNDLSIGAASGDTGYFGRFGGLPLEQSGDDAKSLVFDTPPLPEDLVLFGSPTIAIRLTSDTANGQVVLRLNDVAPDGTVARICYGVRNIAFDDALEIDATSGERSVSIPLHSTVYRVRKGHRLRLAISSSYWPLIWPVAQPGRIVILRGTLRLPQPNAETALPRTELPEPMDLPVGKTFTTLTAPPLERWQTDKGHKRSVGWSQPYTAVHYGETSTTYSFETRAAHTIDINDPTSAQTTIDHRMSFKRPDGRANVASSVTVTATADAFAIEATLKVDWNDVEFGKRNWSFNVPRHRHVDGPEPPAETKDQVV